MHELASPNAVLYELDLASGVLKWDDALFQIFGYDKTETVNTIEWWTAHIHPDDAMTLNQAMDSLLDRSTKGWTVSYRFRKADNSYVLVEDRAVVVRNEAGFAIGLVGSLAPSKA